MNLTQKLAKKYRLSLNSSTKILKKKIKQLQKLQKLAKKLKIKEFINLINNYQNKLKINLKKINLELLFQQ